jgi:hypothetical protein
MYVTILFCHFSDMLISAALLSLEGQLPTLQAKASVKEGVTAVAGEKNNNFHALHKKSKSTGGRGKKDEV